MKVWVRKQALLDSIHSLPFRAWVNSFNEWVPGDIQREGTTPDMETVYFYPFPGYGHTEAYLPLDDIHVDASISHKLIRGGLPVQQYRKIKTLLKGQEQ